MQDDIAEIFSFYQKAGVEVIGVYAISDKGRLSIQELNLASGEEILRKFRYNRLHQLNLRGEGIYFAPKTYACNMLFLDDPARLSGLPRGTMVVQTLASKHQLHIPYVGQPAPVPVRTSPPYQRGLGGCQKHLRQVFSADKGAVYANHQRRLKGFLNQKYPDKPLVKILRIKGR